jgi:AAA15 family ATPase/GTPase
MVAGKVRRKEERTVKFKDFDLLKFSSIFGANASGKSNLINAFSIMQNIVFGDMPKVVNKLFYKLDDYSKNENSYFEVEIVIHEKFYA